MTTKFRFLPEKRPLGAFIAGVVAADLTVDEFEQLPAHMQKAVRAAEFYEEVLPKVVAEVLPQTAVTTRMAARKASGTATTAVEKDGDDK